MLKAKLDSVRKNKKGFSLVELIIVIAIMVALIAVMAPQFVRYVQNSREATLQQAAEEVLAVAKAEYALGTLTGTGTITVEANNDNGPVLITPATSLSYKNEVSTGSVWAEFKTLCGIDDNKAVRSATVYTIAITGTADAPTFAMTKST